MNDPRIGLSDYSELPIYGVDFSHARLIDLSKLADQAQPFYEWIEKQFQMCFHSSSSLQELIFSASQPELESAIRACYEVAEPSSLPKLFDGGGVAYKHKDACFFLFSWMARDAAVQRLKPLIARATKGTSKPSKDVELEVLAALLYKYRANVRHFDWPVIREITMQRLEGSRRAKKGSAIETYARAALSHSFAYYFRTRGNYGKFDDFEIIDKPFKVRNRTYDVAAWLKKGSGEKQLLIMPVKTRETEGGGHAHLFSRDIEQANVDILEDYPGSHIAFVIIAQNWSTAEIVHLGDKYEHVFYFDSNPNVFKGFDEPAQVEMNKLLERILGS